MPSCVAHTICRAKSKTRNFSKLSKFYAKNCRKTFIEKKLGNGILSKHLLQNLVGLFTFYFIRVTFHFTRRGPKCLSHLQVIQMTSRVDSVAGCRLRMETTTKSPRMKLVKCIFLPGCCRFSTQKLLVHLKQLL